MICNACDIYVVIWGPLYVKNKKKDLFGHFAVCQGLGTRQSDHMASPGHQVRRVPRPCTRQTDHSLPCALGAHGEYGSVAMCLPSGHTANLAALPCACRPGTRQIWERCRVPAIRAHGEQPPTPSAGRDGVCPLFFAVSLYIHTAKRFAVCLTFGTRQTRSLPSQRLPSALCRRPPSAKSSPCAYVSSSCASGTRRTRGLRLCEWEGRCQLSFFENRVVPTYFFSS